MKKNISILFSFILICSLLTQCSKKGDAIVEEKIGSYKFTTYTIDTLRFRVVVNDINLGDSLLTPVGALSANIAFLDSVGNLKVYNAETNELFIDTSIALRIGFSTISIVQIAAGTKPFIVPIPNEPAPLAGNYKVRFQYNAPTSTDVPFFDSIKCVIKQSGVVIPIDTIVLHPFEFSRFYESTLGVNFKMQLFNPEDNSQLDNTTNNLISTGFTDFNTASLFGTGLGGVLYQYTVQRIY